MKDDISRTGHTSSLDDFSIIARASREFDLLIFESLLIARDRPSLNSQQLSIPLSFLVSSPGYIFARCFAPLIIKLQKLKCFASILMIHVDYE